MCGIYGYIGDSNDVVQRVRIGLNRLEHRGYDSMGASFVSQNGQVRTYKIALEDRDEISVDELIDKINGQPIDSNIFLAHTRWATHGAKTERNAHPHRDESGRIWLIHNGNVENYKQLKDSLSGCDFYSETDTEVIANLVARYYDECGDLEKAVVKTRNALMGANAFVVHSSDEPEKLIAANSGGSLILHQGKDRVEVVSDPLALDSSEHTPLKSGEIAVITREGWRLVEENKECKPRVIAGEYKKDPYGHYMLKEIMDQPYFAAETLRGRVNFRDANARLGGLEGVDRQLNKAPMFHTVGCGTAYHAAIYATMLFNRFGMSARNWVGSEFARSHAVIDPNDAFIFISQSGETADTLEALNEVRIKGNLMLGVVNVPDSRIWRDTDAGTGIRVGPEKSVASTKAFTAQLIVLALWAVFFARQRRMTPDTGERILKELESIPAKIETILEQSESIRVIAEKYADFNNFYFLGRGFNYISAVEGALKLKEVSYIHAEGYFLGDMKHGPLALVDKDFASVVIIPKDANFAKGIINVREIKARNAPVIGITYEGVKMEDGLFDEIIYIPETLEYLSPILSNVPLQLLAYYASVFKGINPDKPRNLAKVVTVD